MREVLTFGRYYKKRLNLKVRKVPISISGFTCPNIDGTVARGGCSYCLNESFSPNIDKKNIKRFYLNPNKENPYIDNHIRELTTQYYTTREFFKSRYDSDKFIVYFQSFTNSYADIQTLKTLYSKALSLKDVIGISIGTRADSINEEILDFLATFKDKEIWIEYGIQSIFDETLKKINRAENFENVKKWVGITKSKGLKVCGHLIYGLPLESDSMMIESLKESIKLGIDSVKIHPCYVVENTKLAKEFKDGEFEPITQERYIENIVESIKLLPQEIIIQRLTAGIDDESLLAPKWCCNKNNLVDKLRIRLKKEEIIL